MAGSVPGGMDWIYRGTGMQQLQNPMGGSSAWLSTPPPNASYMQPQEYYGGSSGGSYGGSTPQPQMSQSELENLFAKYNPQPPVSKPAQVPAPQAPTRAAGTAQAFARAKNISGRQGAAAIKSLRDAMSSKNMGDSGMEGELTADILSNMARFNTEAAFNADMADDERTWEAAKLGYQGALGQRAGDMDFDLDQRGQDLTRMSQIIALLGRRY